MKAGDEVALGRAPERGLAAALLAIALAVAATAAQAEEREFAYRTVAGDTLIGIAERFLLDPEEWRLLQKRNRIANPRAIPVGTEIRMPLGRMRSQARPMAVEVVRGRAEGATGALAEGDRISTGGDGFVTIRLADGSRVSVPSASSVQVERSRTYGNGSIAETVLRLLGGRLDATVNAQGGSDLFEVRSNRAVTGVRGTRFRVAALDGAVATEVIEGRVGVSEETASQPLEVAGGFGTRVEAGKPPLAPVKLLPAPNLAEAPSLVERTLVRLPFAAVEGARAYRAQVGQDAQFRAIVAEGRFSAPEAKFAELADGDYFLRVRAIDGLDLEGLDAARAFRLKARPEPPLVSRPADKAKLDAAGARVAWSSSTEAATYRLQVSSMPDFSAIAVEEKALADTSAELGSRLSRGTWHWRVASVRADGDQGPWGDARRFTIIPDPPVPKGGEAAGGKLAFEWSGEPGQSFQFQLASDLQFSNLLVDRKLAEPKVAFEEPGSGEFYFRVRAIDADGFVGPYGAAQRIEVSPSPWWLLLLLLIVPAL